MPRAPEEGDRKTTNGVAYVYQNGRWVRESSASTTTTAPPKIGDIDYETAPNGDIIIKFWNGKYWEIDDVRSPADVADSGSAPSYSSTQAGQEAQRAFDAEQDRLDKIWQAEQAELNRQEQRRQGLLSTAAGLLEGRRKSREGAMERASATAGEDVIKFLTNLKGKTIAPGALTPMDVLKQQNAQIAQYQSPTIAPDATIGDLESAIGKMQQQEEMESAQGGLGPFTGLAMGGSINPSVTGRTGIQYGTQKRAIMLGEGTGTGTEIGIVTPGMGITEVIPLSGGAQEGATIEEPSPITLGVLPQLFQTLRQDVGARGGVSPNFLNTSAGLSALGYLTPAQSAAQGASRIGSRGAFATPLTVKTALLEGLNRTPEEAQALSDLIGILPAPHKAAAYFRGASPTERAALRWAYKAAGIPVPEFDMYEEEALIRGPERVGVSLR